MAKLSRKELLEGRESCKALLASTERELAATYSENGAITFRSQPAKDSQVAAEEQTFAFKSPEMKNAILEARSQPLAPAFTR